MTVKILNYDEIEMEHLPGRDIRWVMTPEKMGSEYLTIAFFEVQPGEIVRPLHSHDDIEEAVLIVEGDGEVWVDGERGKFRAGSVILFPANSKHQLRNTGSEKILAYAVFSSITNQDAYHFYTDEGFDSK